MKKRSIIHLHLERETYKLKGFLCKDIRRQLLSTVFETKQEALGRPVTAQRARQKSGIKVVPRAFSSLLGARVLFYILISERRCPMKPMGFVLLVIGVMLIFAARRIVLSKVRLEEKDKNEMEMLASGGVIAVKVSGFIVAVMGFLFLMM